MADKTLTTANSAFSLSARGLFPVPFALEGYSVDDSFSVEDVTPAEAQMGVDGKLSFGFVPTAKIITFMFQPDSPSLPFLDQIVATQESKNEVVIVDGTGLLQGVQDKIAMTKGVITSYTPAATAKKVLQPRKFTFTFQNFTKSPI